ncbi:unnamed protein product [Rotaria sp. Silwood2]|nr:unnamed protein product [Rotaria sp. Silwood2]
MEIEENSNDTSFIDMKRTAIDSSGHLGFFYDACRDCLVEQHNMNHQEESYKTHKTVKGEIKYGNDDKPQNLLRLLSIDEHLILSILLRLTPSTGKASLIDYSHLSNEYTRLFCYSYIDRIQKLPDTIIDIERLMNSPIFSTAATHIITGIEWGHDLVVFLQLPADHHVATQIDNVLNKLLSSLLYENNISSLTQYEESLLENIVHTKVYTNSSELNNLNKVRDVCQYIKENINNISVYPIKYILRPIKYFYPQYNGECVKFTLLSRELNGYIEDYVLQLIIQMKQLEKTIVEDMPKFLCEHLKQQQNNIQIQWLNLKEKIRKEFERLSNLVIQIRNGQAGNLIIEQIFNNNEQMMMNNNVNDLMKNLKNLEEKENFIRYLIQQNFQYLNITEYNINQTDNEKSIQHKLVQNDQHHRILCSNDCLNKDNSEKLHNIICDLVEEAKNNSNIHLIYADFSDCSFQLSSMMVLSSIKDIYEDITHQPPLTTTIETSPSSFTQPEVPILPSSDTDISSVTLAVTSMAIDDTINILLLGETGVGKSTFINAFANYLTFNTLEEAEIGQRVVLIPVSFMITIGDNFEEHIVKFGDIDDLKNEDFNHPGQSVTQHCKSYIFNLNDSDRRKLRIIDTPGFGDTRGIEQDDRNMEHILEYLSNFTHLNAICFLFKPNESKLNIYYRLCFTRLFSLLHQNNVNNVIFCFTNSRSTFYTPGDSGPILKRMLTSLSISGVPFNKKNTFCFDSESFRYLVALQNGIQFSDLDKQEYVMSWIKSVIDAKRLIQYICKELTDRCIQ